MPSRSARRHVWVDEGKAGIFPGLVLGWRRAENGSWEAHVAVVRGTSVLTAWHPHSALRPVTDDSWR